MAVTGDTFRQLSPRSLCSPHLPEQISRHYSKSAQKASSPNIFASCCEMIKTMLWGPSRKASAS